MRITNAEARIHIYTIRIQAYKHTRIHTDVRECARMRIRDYAHTRVSRCTNVRLLGDTGRGEAQQGAAMHACGRARQTASAAVCASMTVFMYVCMRAFVSANVCECMRMHANACECLRANKSAYRSQLCKFVHSDVCVYARNGCRCLRICGVMYVSALVTVCMRTCGVPTSPPTCLAAYARPLAHACLRTPACMCVCECLCLRALRVIAYLRSRGASSCSWFHVFLYLRTGCVRCCVLRGSNARQHEGINTTRTACKNA